MIASAKRSKDKKRRGRSTESRLRRIQQLALDYIDSPEFHRPNAECAILGPVPDSDRLHECVRPPEGLTPYLAALYHTPLLTPRQERHLFRHYNYLKYTATRLREQLDSSRPDGQLMGEIEKLCAQAEQTRNQIIEANLRLVVSLAKPRASNPGELQDLISDGNMTLIRAVEKFDYMLGNKFSTYATWAIRRTFARSIPTAMTHRKRFCNGMDETLVAVTGRDDSPVDEPSLADEWCDKVQQLLDELPQRERYVIVHRFGLLPGGRKETLQALGEELGVTKERVRQLEHRAIDKLRSAVAVAN